MKPRPGFSRALGLFEKTLFLPFLATDAVAGPGYSFQTLLVDLILAGDTDTKAAIFDAIQSFIDQLQRASFVAALAEEKLFRVGVSGFVGNVLSRVFVSLATVLFRF
jgi:hypothetical protein